MERLHMTEFVSITQTVKRHLCMCQGNHLEKSYRNYTQEKRERINIYQYINQQITKETTRGKDRQKNYKNNGK
jgi:hypothetical protein